MVIYHISDSFAITFILPTFFFNRLLQFSVLLELLPAKQFLQQK